MRVKRWQRLLGRIGILALLGLALWNPALPWGTPPLDLLVLVDDSQSMALGVVDEAWRQLVEEANVPTRETRVAVVRFGASPVLELPPTAWDEASLDPLKPPRRHPIDPTRTDVQAALILALRLTRPHRSVALALISDLGETDGHAEAALLQARQAQVPIYGLWPRRVSEPTVAGIESLQMRARARTGQRSPVTVVYQGRLETNGTLQIRVDGRLQAERPVELRPGRADAARFWVLAKDAGVHSVEAVLHVPGDLEIENNRRRTLFNVEGPGTVLYVARDTQLSQVARTLLDQGIQLQRVTAADFLRAASRLPWLSAVVLDDLAVTDLSDRGWRGLAQAVKEYGTGLVVLGGPNSFAAGGYRDSRLEALLPVEVDLPDRQPRAAVLFAVDKSGSMGRIRAGVSRLALARRAVREASSTLLPGDQVGLVLFDIEPKVLVPLHVSSVPEAALQGIDTVQAGGGTRLAPALKTAVKQLADAQAGQRLLVLVTDGFLADESISALETEIQAHGIQVVALAIGSEADLAPLRRLAAAHDGAVFPVADIATLPRLMRQEVERRRAAIETGEFQPRLSRDIPFAAQFGPWPGLTAYSVTRPRPDATVYLESESGDPLLAAHHVGAGRVVALPAGLAEWAPSWPIWSRWSEFVGGLVEWVAGSPRSAHRDLWVSSSAGRIHYVVDAVDDPDAWSTHPQGVLILRDPIGRRTELSLPRIGPGRYAASVAAPLSGPYFATLRIGDSQLRHATLHHGHGESTAARQADGRRRQWESEGLIRDWPADGRVVGSDPGSATSARPLLTAAALVLYLGLLFGERVGLSQSWLRKAAPDGLAKLMPARSR